MGSLNADESRYFLPIQAEIAPAIGSILPLLECANTLFNVGSNF